MTETWFELRRRAGHTRTMELKRVARSMFEARHAGCVCIIIYITLLYLIIIIYVIRYQLRLYTIFYITKCFSTMHWKMLASFSFILAWSFFQSASRRLVSWTNEARERQQGGLERRRREARREARTCSSPSISIITRILSIAYEFKL